MSFLTDWKEKATNYIDVRLGLLKLSLIERTSKVVGHLLLSFIYVFLTLCALSFIGIGLMETFSALLNSRVAGAFITAGLFILLLLLLLALRKSVLRAFAGIFIRVMTEGDEDEDKDEEEPSGRRIKVED
jgi:hypothetical protein